MASIASLMILPGWGGLCILMIASNCIAHRYSGQADMQGLDPPALSQ